MKTIPRVLGLSRDGRTQRWSVTCPKCGHVFEPLTTRLSTQGFECPKAKCSAPLFVDYNAEPPFVKVMEEVK